MQESNHFYHVDYNLWYIYLSGLGPLHFKCNLLLLLLLLHPKSNVIYYTIKCKSITITITNRPLLSKQLII